jgi:GT2 family glycosyltransferase
MPVDAEFSLARMSPAAEPMVGLVIVTHNSAAELERCLEAVRGQVRPPDRIVIADSGSTDGTLMVAEHACERLELPVEFQRFETNVGFAVANNRAVERLDDCDLIALLNPDAFPEPNWLLTLVQAARLWPETASFASRLMIAGAAGLLDGAGDAFHVSGLAWRIGYRRPLDQVPEALTSHPVFAACAAAALYRRADWIDAGGFDERYFCYAEDVDLGFRLQLLGRGCRYVSDAVAHHVGSSTSGVDSAFAVYHGYRNLEWTFFTNMPSRLLWRYLPLHLVAVLAQIAWFTRKGRGGSVLSAKLDALRGLRARLRERRRVQASRRVAVSQVASLLDTTPLLERFGAVRRRPSSRI